eukprot:jgi/Tetstr1/449385/TSEL_003894.t1
MQAFVLQEGYVYSVMLKAFTWTWICIIYIVFVMVITFGTIGLHFRYTALPGSAAYMWVLPFYINLPIGLGLDVVSCTSAFKAAAARKGYAGITFSHEGFHARFVLLVFNAAGLLAVYLFLLLPGLAAWRGVAMNYVMYVLYTQTVAYILLLFYVLPRYANMGKHENALLGRRSRPNSASRHGSTNRSRLVSAAAPEPSFSASPRYMQLAGDVDGEPQVEGLMVHMSSGAFVQAECAFHTKGDLSSAKDAILREMEGSAQGTLPARAHPLLSAVPHGAGVGVGPDVGTRAGLDTTRDGCSLMDSAQQVLPGQVPDSLDGMPTVQVSISRRAELSRSRTTDNTLMAISKTSPASPCQPPLPAAFQRSATDSCLEQGAASSVPEGDDMKDIPEICPLPSPATLQRSATDSRLESGPAGGMRGQLSITTALRKNLGAPPTLESLKAAFGTHQLRGGDTPTENLSKRRTTWADLPAPRAGPHVSSRGSRLLLTVTAAGRLNTNLPVVVARGLRALPGGALELCVNGPAAVKLLANKWRYWAATMPSSFLFTVGFLAVGLITWPVTELPITSSVPAMVVMSAAGLVAIAIGYMMLFGGLVYADQAMILKEASEGGSIGAGLIFSTASLLNALTFNIPVEESFVATTTRVLSAAAVSCRWDMAAAWTLHVRERGGHTRACQVMMPPMQLYRAALAARQAGCTYVWLDSLSVPQPVDGDDQHTTALKEIASRRLIPTMTAVYASAKLVLVVETATGLSDGEGAYSRRTWTLQECMLNQRTTCIHLDGRCTLCGDAPSRSALSGLANLHDAHGMDDLASYAWVLPGDEAAAVQRTTAQQRRAFPEFCASRSAARSADKAVALGQPFFKVLFEHVGVSTTFMLELSAQLARDPVDSQPPVLLIDNSGWDATLSGSGTSTRFLMGRPSFMESGAPSLWSIRRLVGPHVPGSSPAHDTVPEAGTSDLAADASSGGTWWLCEMDLQGTPVQVALLPRDLSQHPAEVGGLSAHLRGHLHQLRTCTEAERALFAHQDATLVKKQVLWV